MWIRPVLAAVLVWPVSAAAQSPMSAIDWLSQSVTENELAVMTEDPVANTVTTDEITVMPLDAVRLDGLGLLPGALTGLPANLWGTTPPQEIAALIGAQPAQALPAVQDMMLTLMLAELDPPQAVGPDGALFAARVDQLLVMGALDQAAALLDEVAKKPAALTRRAFDIALLTGEEDRACAAMRAAPGITPSAAVQVFCRARAGDWSVAQLTLDTAAALGQLSAGDAALLTRFLNPETDEDAIARALPDPVTPLAFRIHEAIGEPIPTAGLPLAFARSDLRALNGWKAQLDAAERLARARAIPAELLFSIYAEGRPAASGGVWERVRAIQAFDTALRQRNAAAVAQTIAEASRAMQQAGLDVALAEYAAPMLADLPMPGRAGALAFRLRLLTPDAELAARARTGASEDEAFLIGLAAGAPARASSSDPMEHAIAGAFANSQPPALLAAPVADGRLGEAMLRAAQLISAGIESDPGDIANALQLFRSIGLERVARAAGLQLLLIARPV